MSQPFFICRYWKHRVLLLKVRLAGRRTSSNKTQHKPAVLRRATAARLRHGFTVYDKITLVLIILFLIVSLLPKTAASWMYILTLISKLCSLVSNLGLLHLIKKFVLPDLAEGITDQ